MALYFGHIAEKTLGRIVQFWRAAMETDRLDHRLGLQAADEVEIRSYLECAYAEIFSEKAIRDHLDTWLGRCQHLRLCQLFAAHFEGAVAARSGGASMLSYARSEMTTLRLERREAEIVRQRTKGAINALNAAGNARNACLVIVGVLSSAMIHRSFFGIASFAKDAAASDFAIQTILDGYSWDRADQLLRQICNDLGVPYCSLLLVFRIRAGKPLYFSYDRHWRPTGQAIAARALAPWIG